MYTNLTSEIDFKNVRIKLLNRRIFGIHVFKGVYSACAQMAGIRFEIVFQNF